MQRFSLNRMSAPKLGFPECVALCQRLGIDAIEIRNDLPGIEITDGTPAAQIKAACVAGGLTILSINALQRFEQFDSTRVSEAAALACYAADCGAKALVLCLLAAGADVSPRLGVPPRRAIKKPT